MHNCHSREDGNPGSTNIKEWIPAVRLLLTV